MANELDSNCLLVGLLFDKLADELGRKMRALADWTHIVTGMPCEDGKFRDLVSFDECQDRLNKQIAAICAEMKPLWQSMQAS
jgi:hypothetical protein